MLGTLKKPKAPGQIAAQGTRPAGGGSSFFADITKAGPSSYDPERIEGGIEKTRPTAAAQLLQPDTLMKRGPATGSDPMQQLLRGARKDKFIKAEDKPRRKESGGKKYSIMPIGPAEPLGSAADMLGVGAKPRRKRSIGL